MFDRILDDVIGDTFREANSTLKLALLIFVGGAAGILWLVLE